MCAALPNTPPAIWTARSIFRLNEIATRIREVTADKQQPIKLYCGVGVRAQMAKFSLEAQGFEQVTNEGAYDSLRAAADADATSCGTSC